MNQQKRDGKSPEASHPPRSKFVRRVSAWILIVFCVFGIYGTIKWRRFRSDPYDLATLTCDRYLLVTDVQQAYRKDQKNPPLITEITDLKEVSRSSAELNCVGSAKLSDGTISSITFRYFIEAAAPHVAYQLKDR